MCQFVSWIEADGRIYFLSDTHLATTRGKALRWWTQCDGDLKGHGAIRRYFGLDNHTGENRECEDFSTPDNFPAAIVAAIKAGNMKGFDSQPEGLLTQKSYADYRAKIAPLDADYEAKRDALDADYEAKRDALYADYEAKRAPLFWNLFMVPENRNPKWR